MRGLPCGSRMHLHAVGSTAQRLGRVGASEVASEPPRGRPDNSTLSHFHDGPARHRGGPIHSLGARGRPRLQSHGSGCGYNILGAAHSSTLGTRIHPAQDAQDPRGEAHSNALGQQEITVAVQHERGPRKDGSSNDASDGTQQHKQQNGPRAHANSSSRRRSARAHERGWPPVHGG